MSNRVKKETVGLSNDDWNKKVNAFLEGVTKSNDNEAQSSSNSGVTSFVRNSIDSDPHDVEEKFCRRFEGNSFHDRDKYLNDRGRSHYFEDLSSEETMHGKYSSGRSSRNRNFDHSRDRIYLREEKRRNPDGNIRYETMARQKVYMDVFAGGLKSEDDRLMSQRSSRDERHLVERSRYDRQIDDISRNNKSAYTKHISESHSDSLRHVSMSSDCEKLFKEVLELKQHRKNDGQVQSRLIHDENHLRYRSPAYELIVRNERSDSSLPERFHPGESKFRYNSSREIDNRYKDFTEIEDSSSSGDEICVRRVQNSDEDLSELDFHDITPKRVLRMNPEHEVLGDNRDSYHERRMLHSNSGSRSPCYFISKNYSGYHGNVLDSEEKLFYSGQSTPEERSPICDLPSNRSRNIVESFRDSIDGSPIYNFEDSVSIDGTEIMNVDSRDSFQLIDSEYDHELNARHRNLMSRTQERKLLERASRGYRMRSISPENQHSFNMRMMQRSPETPRLMGHLSSYRVMSPSPLTGGENFIEMSPDRLRARTSFNLRQRSRSPVTGRSRSRSPVSIRLRSRSPVNRGLRSRSPVNRRLRSRSPVYRRLKIRSPVSRRLRSRSPLINNSRSPRSCSACRNSSCDGFCQNTVSESIKSMSPNKAGRRHDRSEIKSSNSVDKKRVVQPVKERQKSLNNIKSVNDVSNEDRGSLKKKLKDRSPDKTDGSSSSRCLNPVSDSKIISTDREVSRGNKGSTREVKDDVNEPTRVSESQRNRRQSESSCSKKQETSKQSKINVSREKNDVTVIDSANFLSLENWTTLDSWSADESTDDLKNDSPNKSRGKRTRKASTKFVKNQYKKPRLDGELFISIQGLTPFISEVDLKKIIWSSSIEFKDIRVARDLFTGKSLGYALVQFFTISDAVKFVGKRKGVMKFSDNQAIIKFIYPQTYDKITSRIMMDWVCACGTYNHKKKHKCFNCEDYRTHGRVVPLQSEYHKNVIFLTNLDPYVTVKQVHASLPELSSLPVNSLRALRIYSKVSSNTATCSIEMDTHEHAESYFTLLNGDPPIIGGRLALVKYNTSLTCQVKITPSEHAESPFAPLKNEPPFFSERVGPNHQHFVAGLSKVRSNLLEKNPTSNPNSRQSQHAQKYANVDPSGSSSNSKRSQLKSVSAEHCDDMSFVNSVQENQHIEPPDGSGSQKYPFPEVSSFQYDSSSGYYYDHYTGLYYDRNSQYFYNNRLKQFLFWDSSLSSYVLAPSQDEKEKTTISESQVNPVEKENPATCKSKTKVTNKSNKNDEKLAKILSDQKLKAKKKLAAAQTLMKSETPEENLPAMSKDNLATTDISRNESTDSSNKTIESKAVASDVELCTNVETSSDSENQYLDLQAMICLLCKRHFPNEKILTKHAKESVLHKQNLDILLKMNSAEESQ